MGVEVMEMRVEIGPNGDVHLVEEYGPAEVLEKGGTIAFGTFSPATGYSGWWDEIRLEETPRGKVLVARVNETDTSFRDENIIDEVPLSIPWEEVKKHLEGKVGREAYEALWEMVRDEVSQAALYAQLDAESEGENRR